MHAIREVEYLVPASATSDISVTSELSTRGRSLSARGRGARGGRATDRETSTENSGPGCGRDRGRGQLCQSANPVRNSARSPLQDLSNQASFAAPDPPLKKTVIIDAWERLVNCLKREYGVNTIKHLKAQFTRRIVDTFERTFGKNSQGEEVNVCFDPYPPEAGDYNLKAKTGKEQQVKEFDIHNEMKLEKVTMKDLVSSIKNKHHLTKIFTHGLFEDASLKKHKLQQTDTREVDGTFDSRPHSHKEDDTLIPLHAAESLSDNLVQDMSVHSPDSDILCELIDLVSNREINPRTKLTAIIGKAKNRKVIDVIERVRVMGARFGKAIKGLHMLTGADWCGKFVRISKKNQTQANAQTTQAFIELGKNWFTPDSIPDTIERRQPSAN